MTKKNPISLNYKHWYLKKTKNPFDFLFLFLHMYCVRQMSELEFFSGWMGWSCTVGDEKKALDAALWGCLLPASMLRTHSPLSMLGDLLYIASLMRTVHMNRIWSMSEETYVSMFVWLCMSLSNDCAVVNKAEQALALMKGSCRLFWRSVTIRVPRGATQTFLLYISESKGAGH